MDIDRPALLLAHALSTLMALYVAAFFARGRSLAPGRGLGLLSIAFCTLAVGYASAAIHSAPAHPGATGLEAARAASVSAASVFLFAYYGSRRGGWSMRTTRNAVAVGAAVALAASGAYALAGASSALPAPGQILPSLLLASAILLILTALLVTMEVRAQRMLDFRVPLAFICLAFAQYTIALLAFHGGGTAANWWPIAWRLAGLALFTSVVRSSGGVRLARKTT